MISFSPGTANISGNVDALVEVNIPVPGSSQTPIVSRTNGTTTKQTHYTPSAGKTFYLQYIIFDNIHATNVNFIVVYLANGTTTGVTAHVLANTTIVLPGGNIAYTNSTPVLIECDASVGASSRITLIGIEV